MFNNFNDTYLNYFIEQGNSVDEIIMEIDLKYICPNITKFENSTFIGYIENSKLKDVSLMEMYRIVGCRVLVCAVLRSGQAITPGGNFVLKAGDRIFVTAPTSNLATLLKNLEAFCLHR